ncbi:MAG: gluconeogenesis factor YvcK family protein [Patescibacteria group bacterium]
MRRIIKNWWNGLRYEPGDPRYHTGRDIKVAVIGGGTGLANLLRGLKRYSRHISAIVTVADSGSSTGELRREFDIPAPGDIRKCLAALALDEVLVTKLFDYRFAQKKSRLGGHTLGNIWLTALSDYFGSFDKAIEVTSEIFQTAGKVLPATLEPVDLIIEYEDGTKVKGEDYLDKLVKRPRKISLSKKGVRAYTKAIRALGEADLIVIGPGSLYGSVIPNFLIPGITQAVRQNRRAVKTYVANCSTERTQTAKYSIDDHIQAIFEHAGGRVFDHCLVNNKILRRSKDVYKLGEVNNITTDKQEILGVRIACDDIISTPNPLYHNSEKLAESLIELYNKQETEGL